MSESFKPNRSKIDGLIAKALKEAGLKCTVKELVALDRRYSNNTVKPLWCGYERYVDLKTGRTVYVGLTDPSKPSVSVREKADKFAQAKGEKKLARIQARAAKKAVKAKAVSA